MIISVCENPNILSIIRLVKIFINIIKISVPIILIFSITILFLQSIKIGNDDKFTKSKKIAVTRAIVAIIIFITPTFINLIVKITFPNSNYNKCLVNSTSENISSIAYTNIKKDILKLKETLSEYEYSRIYKNLNYLLPKEKESSKKELEEIHKYVEIMSRIKNLNKNDKTKYTELEEIVNNIEDTTIKNTLQKELDKYKSNYYTYDVIKPNSNENIIRQEETDTLKVYITETNTYYLTRIWAEDAYTQLNKEDSPEYGKKLYKPSILLENAIKNNNLDNKLLLGFNASGFYLKDTYDASSVNKYPAYDKTSVGSLVITNGKVIRNNYEKGDILTWFIMGINENNEMLVFEDKKITETTINEKKIWSESVISAGIRNTLTFASPVIENGQRTNYTNENSRMPGGNNEKEKLQLLCQINNNNFILYTAKNDTRDTGIDLFMNLGCKTAVNLDGGGSTTLLFKSANSNNIEKLIGNSRNLPEVAYFSE